MSWVIDVDGVQVDITMLSLQRENVGLVREQLESFSFELFA